MKIGVYPGSFDPFTSGHMDILRRACHMLDMVYVAVLTNSNKRPFFSVEERMAFIRTAAEAEGLLNYRVDSYEGLLVNYVRHVGGSYIVRGLRAVTDFEYEFQMDSVHKRLAPEIETIYYMADPEHAFLSSSIVKEVGWLGGSIDGLVAEENKKIIAERLMKR